MWLFYLMHGNPQELIKMSKQRNMFQTKKQITFKKPILMKWKWFMKQKFQNYSHKNASQDQESNV